MKHSWKITIILIVMFIITQLIGLFIISIYESPDNVLPFEPPEEIKAGSQGVGFLKQLLVAFVIAIFLFLFLTRIRAEILIRFWFFAVIVLALILCFNAVFYFAFDNPNPYVTSIISLIIALPLAYVKIFKRDIRVHNLTELLIYPGIAAVFVPILNVLGIIILLLAISLYDIWAVWHTEFMQKMARYQIENLKFFTGFFVPYAGKKARLKLRKIRQKYKTRKSLEKNLKKAKIKVNLAILGGGDIIFPIIAAGVFLRIFNSITSALIISLTATLALAFLFVLARKGKFYPAMPFITIGIYIGMIINFLLL
jgi:presenilin-like A22 family membrane protease